MSSAMGIKSSDDDTLLHNSLCSTFHAGDQRDMQEAWTTRNFRTCRQLVGILCPTRRPNSRADTFRGSPNKRSTFTREHCYGEEEVFESTMLYSGDQPKPNATTVLKDFHHKPNDEENHVLAKGVCLATSELAVNPVFLGENGYTSYWCVPHI